MARNSLGQFIVQEGGSSVVSIKCDELYITKTQYDLFLLDNKEFTELTPTIDKDALINSLTNEITGLNNTINILSTDAKGGFTISVTKPQYAYPVIQQNAITYNNQKVYENIGFNIKYKNVDLTSFYYELNDKLYNELENIPMNNRFLSNDINMYRAIYHTNPKSHQDILKIINKKYLQIINNINNVVNFTYEENLMLIKKILCFQILKSL